MALSSYRMCDARKTFRLGEAADLWGGTDEQFATPTPHITVPDSPSRDDEASFANFAQPKQKSDATFQAVFKSNKAQVFTKEAAPSGYAVLQILKEAADSGELPVLGSPPINRMTRVRREDLEAFARRRLAAHDWPLPWFLFPGERPSQTAPPRKTKRGPKKTTRAMIGILRIINHDMTWERLTRGSLRRWFEGQGDPVKGFDDEFDDLDISRVVCEGGLVHWLDSEGEPHKRKLRSFETYFPNARADSNPSGTTP